MESLKPPDGVLKTAAGVAGAAVIGPLAAPLMPVLAGIAVAGLGIFAAGSILGQVVDGVKQKGEREDIEDRLPFNG